MSAGVRVSLADAATIAEEVVSVLSPACERIAIAGSIRRGKPDIGDIELVALSRYHDEPSGLFFEVGARVWDLDRAVDEYAGTGAVERLLGKDKYTKLRHVASGLQVDLFTVKPPAQWGVIFLIRTGPAEYSQRFVTGIRSRGFHVRDGALHRGGLGCGAYVCPVIDTPEERDVYAAVGLAPVPAEVRA